MKFTPKRVQHFGQLTLTKNFQNKPVFFHKIFSTFVTFTSPLYFAQPLNEFLRLKFILITNHPFPTLQLNHSTAFQLNNSTAPH